MERFELKNIALVGRTYAEYEKIFRLEEFELKNESVLDAGGGVSSFCAEAACRGAKPVSGDRIYGLKPAELEKKSSQDLGNVMQSLKGCEERYNWDFYKNPEGLFEHRRRAAEIFAADYEKEGTARYVTAEFPNSPFLDNEFTLTLVSHFLFLYDEHLDYDFHRNTIEELLRVTRGEIRIFPLMNLRWKPSEFVDRVINDIADSRIEMTVEKTSFEFIKGGDAMLRIKNG